MLACSRFFARRPQLLTEDGHNIDGHEKSPANAGPRSKSEKHYSDVLLSICLKSRLVGSNDDCSRHQRRAVAITADIYALPYGQAAGVDEFPS